MSNFTPSLLDRAMRVAPIVCNQVEMHPFLQQRTLRTIAHRSELLLTGYCPLARGKVGDSEVLQEIGKKHGKSPFQVALRWGTQVAGAATIPKASRPEHRAANLEIFDFELDADDIRRIESLDANERLIDPDFAPAWEG